MHRCVDLWLGLQLNCIDQHVCFVQILCCFYYYNHVLQIQIRLMMPPANLLLLRIIFSSLRSLCFPMELIIVLSRSVKVYVTILIGSPLNL